MEKVRGRKSVGEGSTKKVYQRRSIREAIQGENPMEKVCRRRSDGERSAREGLSKKVHGRRSDGKVALIPCEDKNNSLIFIN